MLLHCMCEDRSNTNFYRNYYSSDYYSKHSDYGDDDCSDDDDDDHNSGGDDGGDDSTMDPNKDSRMGRIPTSNNCNSMDDSTNTMMDTTNCSPNIYLHPNSLDCRYTNTYWCNSRRSNLYLPQEHQIV